MSDLNDKLGMLKRSKSVKLTDFLTVQQIKQAESLWKQDSDFRHDFHKAVMEQVLVPNMMEINRKLVGQENNADYLAYAIEYIFMKASAA